MALTIKLTGVDEIVQKLKGNKILDSLAVGVDRSSKYIQKEMKINTPVDTGNLRDSEYIERIGNLSAFIGPDLKKAHYAIYVELGHHTVNGSWVPGQFYVERTAVESRLPVKSIFSKILEANYVK